MVVTEEGKYLSVHIIVPENTHKKTSHATNIKLLVNSLLLAHFPKPNLSVNRMQFQLKTLSERRPKVPDLVNSSPPSLTPDWCLNPHKETLLQPLLKSFVTTFFSKMKQ